MDQHSDIRSHSLTVDRVLDQLVALTALRDSQQLADCLVITIERLLDATECSLYALDNSDGVLTARPLASRSNGISHSAEKRLLDRDPEFRRCLDQRSAIFSWCEGERCRIVFPDMVDTVVRGFLVVETLATKALDQYALRQLLRIYRQQAQLLSQHHRDPLTGLFNRSALDQHLDQLLTGARDSGRRSVDNAHTGVLAIFDIDYFKRINDTLGHLYGDEVLIIFADLMRDSFRDDDLLFRYGGEEFVVVLHHTSLDAALQVLERFRQRVAQHRFPQIRQVTVSIGATALDAEHLPTTLMDQADKALYHVKNNGRNQVLAYEHMQRQISMAEAGAGYSVDLFDEPAQRSSRGAA